MDRLWERLNNERRLPLRIGMSWCHAALQPSVQSASGLKVQVGYRWRVLGMAVWFQLRTLPMSVHAPHPDFA